MGWCRFEHTIYFQLNWKATMVLFSLWGLKTCLNELFELIHFTVFFSGFGLKILFKIPISMSFEGWYSGYDCRKFHFSRWQFFQIRHQFENLLIDFPTREFYGFFLGVFLNSSWRPLKISFMTSQTHSRVFFSTSRIPRTKFTWNIFVVIETRNCCKWT